MAYFKRLSDMDVVTLMQLGDYFDVEAVWNISLLEAIKRLSHSINSSKESDSSRPVIPVTLLEMIRDGDTFLTNSIASVAFSRSADFQKRFLVYASAESAESISTQLSFSTSSSSLDRARKKAKVCPCYFLSSLLFYVARLLRPSEF